MNPKFVRRIAMVAIAPLLLVAAACGSDDDGGGTKSYPAITAAADAAGSGEVTVVSQQFPEADILTELYTGLLTNAGFTVKSKALADRKLYLPELQSGKVQISTDYLSSMTDALTKQAKGEKAASEATNDTQETLAVLKKYGAQFGVTALEPAEAQDANAFAVTQEFAEENDISTLSELGALGKEITLGAATDCDERQDCKLGLESTYGLTIVKVIPTGFGSPETKADLKDGDTQLGQVGTSDPTLANDGLVLLEDDKGLQHAENLVPVVNTKWLEANPAAGDALNKLASVLTTDDLAELIAKVSIGREKASDVARIYLYDHDLIK